MIEVKLVAISYSIAPIEDEGKQITFFHDPTKTAYLVPFAEKNVEHLISNLSLSNEELQDKIDKAQTQAAMDQMMRGSGDDHGGTDSKE